MLLIHFIIAISFIKSDKKPKEPIVTKVTALTLDRTPKPSIKNTKAYKAKKKLYKDNMINEPMETVMYVLYEIDKDVRTVDIKESLFDIIHQTFEFSDNSKIEIVKKKEDGVYKILPYGTRIID